MTGRPGQTLTRPLAREKGKEEERYLEKENFFTIEEKKNKEGKGEKYLKKESFLPSNEKEVNIWRM